LISQLAHKSISHFGNNLIALCILGSIAEAWLGSRELLAVYLGGGALTTLAQVTIGGSASVGASGGIWILIGFILPVLLVFWALHFLPDTPGSFPDWEMIYHELSATPTAHEVLAATIALSQILLFGVGGTVATGGGEVADLSHVTGLGLGALLAMLWY